MTVEPVAPADAVMLAIQAGSRVPLQMGVLIELGGVPDGGAEAVAELLTRRAGEIPQLSRVPDRRLGRRLRWRRVPPAGLGDRVTIVEAEPGEDLLIRATRAVLEPLAPDRPLWRAVVVRGTPFAVILVLSHAVADGLGGLAVLDRLLDGAARAQVPRPPGPGPVRGTRALLAAMRASGGLHPRRAEPCSLLAPTGTDRRCAVVDADLAMVRAAAHTAGGSVNDALLAVVAGALEELLAERGERIEVLAVGVPMATQAPGGQAGNANAPLLVEIPCGAGTTRRIAAAALEVATRRASAPPVAPITLLRPVMPVIARLGLYRRYMLRQRRLHTVVSLVRGPSGPAALGGTPVTRIVPLALGEAGSITITVVALAALSRLMVTLQADPVRVPDLDRLADAVRKGFAALTGDTTVGVGHGR